jgi:hypothetical protein
MSISRTVVAISLDHDRLCAVNAAVGGGKAVVKAWLTTQVPSGVDVKDAAAVGAWLGPELDKAGLSRGKLVIAAPRGEVVLKRLKLPRAEGGGGQAEIAGMVRLQMARQLTMAMEGTAIDYIPIGPEEGDGGAAGASMAVLAGALPGDRMAWYQGLAKAAGCKVERLGLRSAGVSALLADISQRHSGPVLGIAVGLGSVEFVIVEDGQLVFARAADGGLASAEGDTAALAQRVAVEAKRTWMSYRVGDGSAEVDAVVVPGEGRLAAELAQKCGESLEMPGKLAELPASIELPANMSEADRLVAAPLIGLIAEELLARPTLDFANPRKAPDRAAAKRQLALGGVLAAILLGAGGYFLASDELSGLRTRLKEASGRGGILKNEYNAYLKEDARLSHIKQWTSANTDWLAHTRWLSEQMPDPRQALMDEVSGQLRASVDFNASDGTYDKNGWQVRQVTAIGIEGHIKQREIANDLRNRLVTSGQFLQVESKGADEPTRFEFSLTTNKSSPEAPSPSSPPASSVPKPAKGGGT